MNEFYENKFEEEGGNEFRQRQIEDKYASIEKVKEEYMLKID